VRNLFLSNRREAIPYFLGFDFWVSKLTIGQLEQKSCLISKRIGRLIMQIKPKSLVGSTGTGFALNR
jgi:hypothetical protein